LKQAGQIRPPYVDGYGPQTHNRPLGANLAAATRAQRGLFEKQAVLAVDGSRTEGGELRLPLADGRSGWERWQRHGVVAPQCLCISGDKLDEHWTIEPLGRGSGILILFDHQGGVQLRRSRASDPLFCGSGRRRFHPPIQETPCIESSPRRHQL
jgi:hypothetical protein